MQDAARDGTGRDTSADSEMTFDADFDISKVDKQFLCDAGRLARMG